MVAPCSNRHRSPAGWILAPLIVLACDPPAGTERIKDDTMLRQGARDDSRRNQVSVAAIRDAKVVVLRDGTIELYDRHGELRAQVLDPQARFVSTLEPITGTENWAKPHPYVTVPLPGLADWLTRRGHARRAKEALAEVGLSDSQRVMIAIAEAAETTEWELAALDGELTELWADTSRPASDRRRLLFERWDECEEGDGSGGGGMLRVAEAEATPDALRKQAGERARAMIEAFIRRHLPAGSKDAFTPAELAALDARRYSERRFDPYGSTAVADRAGPTAGQSSN